jgi:hypothetical protein
MARRDVPFSVEIPQPGADRPLWGKVGLVAAAGFVIGVAWPRLTNLRIAPSPPGEGALTAEPSASAVGARGPVAGSAAGALTKPPVGVLATGAGATGAAPPAEGKSPAPPGSGAAARLPVGGSSGVQGATQRVATATTSSAGAARDPVVGTGFVLHCRDEQEEMTECGSFQFDAVAVPRLKALSRCPAAKGANGKLSLGFDIDYRAKAVRLLLGKSTTLPRDTADALVRCTDSTFEQAGLVPHDHRQYTVFYSARFGEATPAPASNDRAAPASASGDGSTAIVAWDVAILRDSPKSGAVVERVLKGAKVKILSHDGSWYRVQYQTFQGWVYREAIGL